MCPSFQQKQLFSAPLPHCSFSTNKLALPTFTHHKVLVYPRKNVKLNTHI